MENQERLPRGYEKRFVIDPRKNRKQALAVWGVSLLIALVLFGVAQAIWQGQALLLFTHRVTFYVTWVILIFGFLIYAVLHEVIRGLCVRLVTGRRPQHYDNTLPGVYMNSASPVFLSKRAFAAIALAPVAILGAVLVLLNLSGGFVWFWPIYFIQWFNLSKAVTDCWGLWKLRSLPDDALVWESGISVTGYALEK